MRANEPLQREPSRLALRDGALGIALVIVATLGVLVVGAVIAAAALLLMVA
jgi:hypothetical protein